MLSFIPAESSDSRSIMTFRHHTIIQLKRKYQPLVEQAPPHTPVRELSKKVKHLNVRSLMTS